MITLDTLRFDVAQEALETGQLNTLSRYLPESGWEKRHTPASYTYAAHHSFFAGFLPTPVEPGIHPRLYACEFNGSESTHADTYCFKQSTLPRALGAIGYQTICIGGTGFFNLETEIGRDLPSQFQRAIWNPNCGVANQNSHVHQIDIAISEYEAAKPDNVFLFINIAAIHQPNWFYSTDNVQGEDNLKSHQAALIAVDKQLRRLFDRVKMQSKALCMIFSDHGTAYGEDNYLGHRVGHPVVWEVPYAEFML